MKRLLVLAGLPVLCLGLWLTGCSLSTSFSLSRQLEAPQGASPLLDAGRIAQAIARVPHRSGFTTSRDGVALFWRLIDPGDYRLSYRYSGQGRIQASGRPLDVDFDFAPPPATATVQVPRGTLVLLHGWMMDGDSLLPWSLTFARAGYRVLTLDLRNHGHSGPGPSGYGTRESDDLVDVLADLRRRGELAGPLHLFGISYGAATALFAADKLGPEVASVVALESFDNAGRGIRDMVPHMLASEPSNWEGRAVLGYARWRYADRDLGAVIGEADRALGLDLDRIDVAPALQRAVAHTCTLLLHGDRDQHIPVAHGRRLATGAPQARYVEVRGEDHISLPLRLDLLGDVVTDWMARSPSARGGCGQPHLPDAAGNDLLVQGVDGRRDSRG